VPALAFFGTSVALGFVAWGIIAARYLWPALRSQPRARALQPLLLLHSFRFIGLAFLVPGGDRDGTDGGADLLLAQQLDHGAARPGLIDHQRALGQ